MAAMQGSGFQFHRRLVAVATLPRAAGCQRVTVITAQATRAPELPDGWLV